VGSFQVRGPRSVRGAPGLKFIRVKEKNKIKGGKGEDRDRSVPDRLDRLGDNYNVGKNRGGEGPKTSEAADKPDGTQEILLGVPKIIPRKLGAGRRS